MSDIPPLPQWHEIDVNRLIVLDALVEKSLKQFPDSSLIKDMHFLLDIVNAAELEIERLRTLCHSVGLVTTPPKPERL